MSVPKSIQAKRSVRTFDGTGLRAKDAQKILDFADKAENPYNLPIEWKLLDAKKDGVTSPVILGTDVFIAGKMRRVPHAEEAFGYTFEKIVLYAESLGIGTTWIAGTMDRKAFEKAMNLSEEEVLPCVSPLGYAANRMSLRETMMRKGIKADARFDFEELFFDGSFEKALRKEEAGDLADVLEAVRLGPSAVNKQPWRIVLCGDRAHFYEKRSKNYTTGEWDIQKIDMGIALCHFDLAARENGKDTMLELRDPGIPTEKDMRYIATYHVE